MRLNFPVSFFIAHPQVASFTVALPTNSPPANVLADRALSMFARFS